jgi:hypothetical protein
LQSHTKFADIVNSANSGLFSAGGSLLAEGQRDGMIISSDKKAPNQKAK